MEVATKVLGQTAAPSSQLLGKRWQSMCLWNFGVHVKDYAVL